MPTQATERDEAAHGALRTLRDRVPRLLEALGVTPDEDVRGALQTLDSRVLPRLSPDFPLMAAIAGGGSAGKSTLFNSLVGADLSTVGGRAGLSRRVLVAVHPDAAARPAFLAELFRPFGASPTPLTDPMALTAPGPPQYVTTDAISPTLILLDTPDFDVGAGGEYLNRGVAEAVLAAADVLVYIFTNATYNAKHNTDFLRDQLTRVGRRACVLVYRAYASYADADVRAHAATVADNLYGPGARDHVLGVFRADDDNTVASGAAPMTPRPLDDGPGLVAILEALDPRALRAEQNEVMVRDVSRTFAAVLAAAAAHREALAIHRDALAVAESHAVAHAIAQLPLTAIIERIRVIFERTDSGFVRFSRAAGRVTGAPVRGLKRLFGGKKADQPGDDRGPDPLERARAALVEAANELRRQTLAEELTTATTRSDPDGGALLDRVEALRRARGLTGSARPFAEATTEGASVSLYVTAPAVLADARAELLTRSWPDALGAITRATDELIELPPALDAELETIVAEFRRDMPFFKRARAAVVGSLNIVPTMLGVVYVFATADPVGGSALSAKIAGLFGLNDLWATVAIPASSGLDEATRNDLKRVLDPVLQRWLASRAAPIEALFREHITATSLAAVSERLERSEALIAEARAALARLP